MTDFIENFINEMTRNGCAPDKTSDILADDKKRRYKLADDKAQAKSGEYQLRIDDSFAVGWYRNYKLGEYFTFSSRKKGVKYTAAEKKAIQDKIKKQKAAQEKQRLEEMESAAKKAVNDLKGLKKATANNSYLKNKGVGSFNLLLANAKGELVIPAYDKKGKLWTYQRITKDGMKLFLKNGKKEGCYFPLAKREDKFDVIFITEGLATGLTIRETMDLPVVVAFDCGNLMPVTDAIRAKYPKAKIIIAADNDQWTTKPNGELYNAGVEKASEAAGKYSGFVVHPEFPEDDKQKRTDFNDLYLTEGKDAVNVSLSRALREDLETLDSGGGGEIIPFSDIHPAATGDPSETDWTPDVVIPEDFKPSDTIDFQIKKYPVFGKDIPWKEKVNWKSKGNSIATPNSLHNAIVFLRENPLYAGLFQWNEFESQIYMTREPPWSEQTNKEFKVRMISETDRSLCEAWLESDGFKCNKDMIRRAIQTAAEAYSFHPVQDYMKALKWDGKPRLNNWLKYYLRAEAQPNEYLSKIGTMWLVAGVRRIMQPGAKFDHMMILEGNQGCGKSSCLQIMATFGKDRPEKYFNDSINFSQIETRGAILSLQGVLIVEFQELAGFNKKDINELKKWMTVQEDVVEVKFAQETRSHPRQFIMAGTFNPDEDHGWLRDRTGNRRFWPVKVCGTVRFDELERDREQLWAEAAHLEAEGYNIHLPTHDHVYQLAQIQQEMRIESDVWDDLIKEIAKGQKSITTDSLLNQLGIPVYQRKKEHSYRIGGIMRGMGWTTGKVSINGTRKSGWVAPSSEVAVIEQKEQDEMEIPL